MSVYMHSNNGLKKHITACTCALHFMKKELHDNLVFGFGLKKQIEPTHKHPDKWPQMVSRDFSGHRPCASGFFFCCNVNIHTNICIQVVSFLFFVSRCVVCLLPNLYVINSQTTYIVSLICHDNGRWNSEHVSRHHRYLISSDWSYWEIYI